MLLFKWSKLVGNRVEGELRVYNRNATGDITQIDGLSIFPIQPRRNTGIPITRGQLFGRGGALPESNPADIWRLAMGRLREAAEKWIRFTGYVSAL